MQMSQLLRDRDKISSCWDVINLTKGFKKKKKKNSIVCLFGEVGWVMYNIKPNRL